MKSAGKWWQREKEWREETEGELGQSTLCTHMKFSIELLLLKWIFPICSPKLSKPPQTSGG